MNRYLCCLLLPLLVLLFQGCSDDSRPRAADYPGAIEIRQPDSISLTTTADDSTIRDSGSHFRLIGPIEGPRGDFEQLGGEVNRGPQVLQLIQSVPVCSASSSTIVP